MNHQHKRTVIWFTFWGLIYGLILGSLSGTMILPGFGTIYAATWGIGIGLTLGLVCGIATALVNATRFQTPYDLTTYRRHISVVVGVFVSLAAPLLIVATTYRFIWGPSTEGFFPYFVPSLLGAMFWGGLSAAYAASRYADFYTSSLVKQKNDTVMMELLPPTESNMPYFLRRLGLTGWWSRLGMGLLIVAYAIFKNSSSLSGSATDTLSDVFQTLLNLLVVVTILVWVVSITGGYLVAFVRRLILTEYFPELSAEKLQHLIAALVHTFALVVMVPLAMTLFNMAMSRVRVMADMLIFASLLQLMAWRMTQGYGAWALANAKRKDRPARKHLLQEHAAVLSDQSAEITASAISAARTSAMGSPTTFS